MRRLTLDIAVDDAREPSDDVLHVHGSVRDEHGAETAFVGWVGLMAVLQQAVSDEQAALRDQARAPR